jgi:tetratricopeptide (TPR) repeat protein
VQPQNHIRQVNEPIASYYFHLAIILFDEKDYEECLKMLEYVLSYNPVYIEALLLKSECYLQTGYNNFFFDNIKEALLYSYTRVHFAKIYFLLGRYYLELNNKETALAFFVVSKHYDKTPFIDLFIKKATDVPGEFIKFDNPADLLDQFNRLNIQFGPSKLIIELLNNCISDAKKNNNTKLLKYFLTLIVNLT